MQEVGKISGVADRILYLVDLFKVKSPGALARRAGISPKTIEAVIRRGAIGPETAAKLGDGLKVRPEWIVYGRGEIFEEEAGPETTAVSGAYSIEGKVAKRYGVTPGPPADEMREDRPLIGIPAAKVDVQEFVFLRKARARLSAGGGLVPEEGFLDTEPYAFRLSWLKRVATSLANVVLVEVEGDSMSPTLQNGNAALIDLGRTTFRPGKLFAIRLGDIIQIKRVDINPAGIIQIYSDNPLYSSQQCTREELHIIGQLIWSARTWV